MSDACNEVELDAEAALAELEQIGATADAEQQAAETAAAGHDPGAWRAAADFIVQVAAGQIAPNWELSAADQEQVAVELAAVLDHYFPGGPHGVANWHPIYRLAFVLLTVAVTRGMDWSTGQLKPLRKELPREQQPTKQTSTDQAAGRDALVPRGDDSQREVGNRFTLGGA